MDEKICIVTGCDRADVYAHGLCQGHYTRKRPEDLAAWVVEHYPDLVIGALSAAEREGVAA